MSTRRILQRYSDISPPRELYQRRGQSVEELRSAGLLVDTDIFISKRKSSRRGTQYVNCNASLYPRNHLTRARRSGWCSGVVWLSDVKGALTVTGSVGLWAYYHLANGKA